MKKLAEYEFDTCKHEILEHQNNIILRVMGENERVLWNIIYPVSGRLTNGYGKIVVWAYNHELEETK